jgi:acetoin utilization deacetylase AcuC-like enzyme
LHATESDPFFWGSSEAIGQGQGKGYNVNVNLPDYTGDDEYLTALESTIDMHVRPFQPSVLVVSLGVDTFEGDPVGNFQITSPGFIKIGELIKKVGVPTLFVMEGGYDSPELGTNVCNVLQGFQGIFSKET